MTIGAHGNADGQDGDSDGNEINISEYTDKQWTGVLRYVGASTSEKPEVEVPNAPKSSNVVSSVPSTSVPSYVVIDNEPTTDPSVESTSTDGSPSTVPSTTVELMVAGVHRPTEEELEEWRASRNG